MSDVRDGEWRWQARCTCGGILVREFGHHEHPKIECELCGRQWELVAGMAICKRGPTKAE